MDRVIITNDAVFEILVPVDKFIDDTNFINLWNKTLLFGLPFHNELIDDVLTRVIQPNFIAELDLKMLMDNSIVIHQLKPNYEIWIEVALDKLTAPMDNHRKLIKDDKCLIPIAEYQIENGVPVRTLPDETDTITRWLNAYANEDYSNVYSTPKRIEEVKNGYLPSPIGDI